MLTHDAAHRRDRELVLNAVTTAAQTRTLGPRGQRLADRIEEYGLGDPEALDAVTLLEIAWDVERADWTDADIIDAAVLRRLTGNPGRAEAILDRSRKDRPGFEIRSSVAGAARAARHMASRARAGMIR